MTSNHTIRDVAREAGVSVATVSRVHQQQARCFARRSPASRGRDRQVGVRPQHPVATAHHGQDTGDLVAVPSHRDEPEPHLPRLHHRCHDGVRGARLSTRSHHAFARRAQRCVDLYRSSKSDGTVLMKVQLERLASRPPPRDGPPVRDARPHRDASVGASFIDYDFDAAVQVAVGRTSCRSAIATSRTCRRCHRRRASTVRRSERCGRTPRHALDLDLPQLDYQTDHDLRHIRLMTTNMLARASRDHRLMTMREMVETALFSAVHDAGLRVPDDISVLGLTTPHGPELTSPALTAMEFPAWSMAYEAGRMMIDELEGVSHDQGGAAGAS